MSERFSKLPEPPYYACIFSTERTEVDEGYGVLTAAMLERATQDFACLGVESTRDAAGFGITISYWKDEDAIQRWYGDAKHIAAQKLGKQKFYKDFAVRIAKVEHAYQM